MNAFDIILIILLIPVVAFFGFIIWNHALLEIVHKYQEGEITIFTLIWQFLFVVAAVFFIIFFGDGFWFW
tara:strand:- start:321 stop:530 length:210 start_codon:yes stop_codon:yes gene_type:complete